MGLTDIFAQSEFSVFRSVYDSGGVIKAMKLENQSMTRKQIDDLTEVAKSEGARGLAYIIYDDNEEGGKKSPILKFMSQEEIADIEERLQPKNGDILFFSADKKDRALAILNKVRLALRDMFSLA